MTPAVRNWLMRYHMLYANGMVTLAKLLTIPDSFFDEMKATVLPETAGVTRIGTSTGAVINHWFSRVPGSENNYFELRGLTGGTNFREPTWPEFKARLQQLVAEGTLY